jgi:hypothetical protein
MMHKALTHDPLKQIRRETPSNLWKQAKNKGTKNSTKRAAKKQQKQLGNRKIGTRFGG